jgi:hypothetical protein
MIGLRDEISDEEALLIGQIIHSYFHNPHTPDFLEQLRKRVEKLPKLSQEMCRHGFSMMNWFKNYLFNIEDQSVNEVYLKIFQLCLKIDFTDEDEKEMFRLFLSLPEPIRESQLNAREKGLSLVRS